MDCQGGYQQGIRRDGLGREIGTIYDCQARITVGERQLTPPFSSLTP